MNDSCGNNALARGFRLGKLGLSLTGSYLGYQAQNLFLDKEGRDARRKEFQLSASQSVRKQLEQLKGPFMKFGQILSMQSTALPKEMLQELSRLQMRAPGMHPSLARAQFKASCGKYPEDVFRKFEPEPLAAASLGQVHEAITKHGERVAVKIQYPAIRTAIENDFKLMRSATLPGRLSGYLPANILDELQRGFLDETDYLNEAKNVEYFREQLKGFSFLTIPKVYREFTTDRVLTMSFIEGKNIHDYLQHETSAEKKNELGNRLYEMVIYQLQSLLALHADPHPGNFLIGKQGQIGLVDFGCVKRFSSEIPELTRCFIDRSWKKGDHQMLRMMRMVWGDKITLKDTKARRLFLSFTEYANILFPLPESGSEIVDFGQDKLLNTLGANYKKVLENKLVNAEFAFITRTELGLFNLLHELGAKIDTKAVWRRILQANLQHSHASPSEEVAVKAADSKSIVRGARAASHNKE